MTTEILLIVAGSFVGGFINGLRPVNLARPLIEAARQGAVYSASTAPTPPPSGAFDIADTVLLNLIFTDGVFIVMRQLVR